MKYLVEYIMTGSIEIEADSKEEALSTFNDLSELELVDNIFGCYGTCAGQLDN